MLTGLKGINSGGNDVLTCRQVATVLSALGKAPHVLAIDGQDKAEIAPEISDPSND
jgi:hypothetical protein